MNHSKTYYEIMKKLTEVSDLLDKLPKSDVNTLIFTDVNNAFQLAGEACGEHFALISKHANK